MTVTVFGIRHHGPGSARALSLSLEALAPDAVLIEGPPDAAAVLHLASDPAMKPPVALLVYPPDAPKRAVYYPFATFSPEWQALQYAAREGALVEWMDLPIAHRLAAFPDEEEAKPNPNAEPAPEVEGDGNSESATPTDTLKEDPLGMLAEAAGFEDREAWWEQQIESRQDARGLFEGILEAMRALREEAERTRGRESSAEKRSLRIEQTREAWMRRTIRGAEKAGRQNIAVVCGAWHAPALSDLKQHKKADDQLLKGLAKIKVTSTWIPWTYDRLAYRSGYGAGVESPGWYAQLFDNPTRATVAWSTRAARLLREQDLDASSAEVIETVRLAEALSALRDVSVVGLGELRDAIRTVLCQGEDTQLALVQRKLEVGIALGQVPGSAPQVPLMRDLELSQKRLRLKPSAEIRTLELDLRKELDRGRGCLLHRLNLLGVPWGELLSGSGDQGTGSFRETFRLVWEPELSVAVVDANLWGNTVESAAASKLVHEATRADLPILTEMLAQAVLAELPDALSALVAAVQEKSSLSADINSLMRALVPLARVARYGDVRQTAAAQVLTVVEGIFERVVLSLPMAGRALDDDAAQLLSASITSVHEVVGLLQRADMSARWREGLGELTEAAGVHGLVRGRIARLRFETNALDAEGLTDVARRALSAAAPAGEAAAWIEGLVRGSGVMLLRHRAIWVALDGWMQDLTEDSYIHLLPLLRRAFAEFAAPERRAMAEQLVQVKGRSPDQINSDDATKDYDAARAQKVTPVLVQMLIGGQNG